MGVRLSLALVLSLGLVSGLATHASADVLAEANDGPRPRGTKVWVEPEAIQPASHSSNVIFLNPCWGGCTIYRGQVNDSRTDRSTIVNGTVNISQFAYGEATWNNVVQCVREMYEPFNIEIVTDDPGNVPHFEAIVAGRPQEAGFPSGVGGVAPFSCGIINNAITFSFANVYGGSVQQICEVVAQETAHAFGLDHEFYCPDPMTYLYGCGAKKFRDYNAPCGENQARNCQCGGTTQNSYQRIIQHFGPAQPTPPSVVITEPSDGAEVQPGFIIRANATDNIGVSKVELYIDGNLITSMVNGPYIFNAPESLAEGGHEVEVRAYDNKDTPGSAKVNVILGEPCRSNSDCPDGDLCVDGRCVPGGDGGLGDSCENDLDCTTGICANDGTNHYCVVNCLPGHDIGCPTGFSCLAADQGTSGVCWPSEGEGGGCGGCTSNGTPNLPLTIFGFLGVAFLLRRRRA